MERDPLPTIQAEPQAERLLEHHAWLRGLAKDLVPDASHADDVVQETLLAALTCREGGPRRPVPWLKTVLRNCVRQSHRARVRRRRREERAARPERVVATADRACEREELEAQLNRHVARLREPYRSTIVLHYFGELPLEEIARRQGLASATVRTRLRRALEELRRRMPARERLLGTGFALGTLGALRANDATATIGSASVRAAAHCTTANVSSSLSIGGVMQLGTKSVALAFAVSAGLFGTMSGLYLLDRNSGAEISRSETAPALASSPEPGLSSTGERAGVVPSIEASRAAKIANAALELRAERAAPLRDSGEPPAASLARDDRGIGEPATGAVMALRSDFSELRRLFNAGGNGWKLVGDGIAKIRETITQSDEGFEEFLALVDDEKDGPFLEAILHHLPLRSGSAFQKEIAADEELHEELWARFEEEPDAYRRRSLLRFFCYNPQLSGKRMAEFGAIAQSDESPLVRSISLDAISSADFPKATWPALCEIAEHDADESIRALATRGLARADSDRAGEIYRAAFTSESEAIRAAAVSARAYENPPPDAVGGDFTSYLVHEFRDATTQEYRQALIDRLLAVSPVDLLHEANRALQGETDRQVKRQYRKAIETARARVERRG